MSENSRSATSSSESAVSAERERLQAKYRETCDKYVQNGLQKNPTIQFLIERLVNMGCEPPKGFIRCMDCGDDVKAGGGFGVIEETIIPQNSSSSLMLQDQVRSRAAKEQCKKTKDDIQAMITAEREGKVKLKLLPEIFLCQQHVRNESHAHEALAHELIHAIDLCRTNMDPITNCIHLACTEIRAENLSGECSWFQELGNRQISKFPAHNMECVKRRALLSVKANPNCKDQAEKAVEAAFERCYSDTFPFDRHPNLKF